MTIKRRTSALAGRPTPRPLRMPSGGHPSNTQQGSRGYLPYIPTKAEIRALRRYVQHRTRWQFTPEEQLLIAIAGSPEQQFWLQFYQALRHKFWALETPRPRRGRSE